MSPAADSKSKVTEPKRRLWRMKRGGGIGRKGELPLERGKATIEDAELRPFDASQGFFDSLKHRKIRRFSMHQYQVWQKQLTYQL